MATRKATKPPDDLPESLVAMIEHYRKTPESGRPTLMLDALCDDVSLRAYLIPEGTEPDASAWAKEWRAFKTWATTDMTTPMPDVGHMIEGKLRSQKVDFAVTPKGSRRKGARKRRDRTASDDQIDAYCDDLLAMPEHRNCGWTFALRLMRYLGAGSDYEAFRARFEMAQTRAGVTSKRRRRSAPEPEPVAEPEPPKRGSRKSTAA